VARRAINTEQAGRPRGPYNQAVQVGSMIFVSAQNPVDPTTGQLVEGGIEDHTRRVIESIAAILAEGGATLEQVVRTTVFLLDLNEFAAMNAVYAEYFSGLAPARSTIQVGALPNGARLQMDAIAVLDDPAAE
jgi:2-iminobutanoate/2-iminopropanoate deaminase